MTDAIPTPAQKFGVFIHFLTQAVAAMSGGDRLSYFLIGLIAGRLQTIKRAVARIAGRIAAGTYAARQPSIAARKLAPRRPCQPGPLKLTCGWLVRLLPDANGYRCQLEQLFRDPEMAALLAAAPASLARPLRSLCWMLRLPPPPALARARRAPRPEAQRTEAPRTEAPPPLAGLGREADHRRGSGLADRTAPAPLLTPTPSHRGKGSRGTCNSAAGRARHPTAHGPPAHGPPFPA